MDRFDPYTGQPLRPVHTIEKTGKRWKALQLIGFALLCFGVMSCAIMSDTDAGVTAGSWMALGGFACYVYARVGAWWHHG